MKIKVTLKDPDTLHDAIADSVARSVESLSDTDERAAISEVRTQKAAKIAAKWFRYSEYLTVEIDTDEETIAVLPAKDC